MTVFSAHPELVGALVAGAVLMMMRLGVRIGVLAVKHDTRRCPSCGRLHDGIVCRTCARR